MIGLEKTRRMRENKDQSKRKFFQEKMKSLIALEKEGLLVLADFFMKAHRYSIPESLSDTL